MKLPVLPPDINESFGDFTVVQTPPIGRANQRGGRNKVRTLHHKESYQEIADSIIGERLANK